MAYIKIPAMDNRPLHPLSDERLNAVRAASSTPTTSTHTSKHSTSRSVNDFPTTYSPQSSPTRHSRADLGLEHRIGGSPSKISGFTLADSPSLPDIHLMRSHARTNSDVQGLVKRFEHLDVRDRDAETAERRRKLEAELRRAQVAREEAEGDVQRLREETRRLKKERDEGGDRERKVSKRLEVVMEEFANYKEANSSQAGLYEKELRRARKEAFRSSSAVVKLQQELKSTRATLRVSQSTLELEKQKSQRKEQDRFELEYQLIPLQEETHRLREQLRIADEERESMKRLLKQDDLARIASEGMIALPSSQEQDADLMSPRRSPERRAPSPLSDDKENIQTPARKSTETRRLIEELQWERGRREHAEELAEFLRMECMFKCCNYKGSTPNERDFLLGLDAELAVRIEKVQQSMMQALAVEAVRSEDMPEPMNVEVERGIPSSPIALSEAIEIKAESVLEHEMHDADEDEDVVTEPVEGSDNVVSGLSVPDSPGAQLLREEEEAPIVPRPTPVDELLEEDARSPSSADIQTTVPLRSESSPQPSQATPFRQHSKVRTVTTTTTIPMQFTPVSKPALRLVDQSLADEENENMPQASAPPKTIDSEHAPDYSAVAAPNFDRAAALAAIEARRGRARSFAAGHATPRKQMIEGVRDRRDISAPTLGQKAVAAPTSQQSAMKRSGSVGRHVRR